MVFKEIVSLRNDLFSYIYKVYAVSQAELVFKDPSLVGIENVSMSCLPEPL